MDQIGWTQNPIQVWVGLWFYMQLWISRTYHEMKTKTFFCGIMACLWHKKLCEEILCRYNKWNSPLLDNIQSSLRCNKLMMYTTYTTDLRGTSCLSTVVSKSKTYPYLYGVLCSSYLIHWIIPFFCNLIVSWYSICSQLIDSAGIYGWWYTLEFKVGCFSVNDTDSLVTLWLACFVHLGWSNASTPEHDSVGSEARYNCPALDASSVE